MTRLLPTAALLSAAGLMLCFATQEVETVDFTAVPNAGLKFKVTSKATGESSMEMSIGDAEPREMNSTTSMSSVFTQTILAVKDKKITKLERSYEDVNTTIEMEMTGRDPMERETESPLAWKHVRIEWTDDEVTVEVKEDDEWEEPEEKLRKAIRPKRWRKSSMPLPKEPKKVGDTWELTGEEAKKAFPVRQRRRPGAEDEEPPEIDVKASFEFVSISDFQKMKCAVLKIKVTTERNEDSKSENTTTLYYSLEHRIVVHAKSEVKTSSSTEREVRGQSLSMETTATNKRTMTVKVLEPGKPASE